MKQLTHYYLGAPLKGVSKRYALYGSSDGITYCPLVHFVQPKWMSGATFLEVLEQIEIICPEGILVPVAKENNSE